MYSGDNSTKSRNILPKLSTQNLKPKDVIITVSKQSRQRQTHSDAHKRNFAVLLSSLVLFFFHIISKENTF